MDSQITDDKYTFATKNDVTLEIKCRITLSDRYYNVLNGQLINRGLSHTMKLILNKMLILPVLLYGLDPINHRCISLESIRDKSSS